MFLPTLYIYSKFSGIIFLPSSPFRVVVENFRTFWFNRAPNYAKGASSKLYFAICRELRRYFNCIIKARLNYERIRFRRGSNYRLRYVKMRAKPAPSPPPNFRKKRRKFSLSYLLPPALDLWHRAILSTWKIERVDCGGGWRGRKKKKKFYPVEDNKLKPK